MPSYWVEDWFWDSSKAIHLADPYAGHPQKRVDAGRDGGLGELGRSDVRLAQVDPARPVQGTASQVR